MLENMPFWIYGAAALVDTVLLFALLERHNWRAVTIWMLLLAVGVWSWHSGTFVRYLVDVSVGPLADPVRWLAMCGMAFGLMLMPSAALHGTWRLLRHGQFQLGPHPEPRLMICYLPLVLLVPMSRALAADPSQPFLSLLADYRVPYGIWLCLATGVSALGLLRTARCSGDAPVRRFYQWIAASLFVIAALTVVLIARLNRDPSEVTVLQTVVGVSPILPALLFAYFVMRFQLLPLVLERTLVYGAVLMGAMLFHEVVLREIMTRMEDRYRLDLGVIEGVLVLMLVLLYQPLRYRVAAALQSLLDSSTARRDDRQRLAVQLAARAGHPVSELLSWFTSAMQRSFGSELGAAWLCSRDGGVVERAGAANLLADHQVPLMLASMANIESSFVTRYSAPDAAIVEFLDRVRAGALLRFEHDELCGLFLIGCRAWGQPPSDEDLHAMSLLIEQFGVTLHNSRLQAVQLAAEHRVLQQEKLSTLGLVASSLAHEIKNPLSSIKTITRVLSEELGPQSPHAEDLRMIAGEIERLSASTSELLEAARPPREGRPAASLAELLSPTLRLLQHLARERQAQLDVSIPDDVQAASLDEISLREIVFNLISNGLEAAGAGGKVCFACRQDAKSLTFEVRDTGPGFTAEQRPLLFEPFFTTKATGTGLGLYIVARRVRDMGGQIECHSAPHQGTTFSVRFPLD